MSVPAGDSQRCKVRSRTFPLPAMSASVRKPEDVPAQISFVVYDGQGGLYHSDF